MTVFLLDLSAGRLGDPDRAAAMVRAYARRGAVFADDALASVAPAVMRLSSGTEAEEHAHAWFVRWLGEIAALPAAASLSPYRGVSTWDATQLSLVAVFLPVLRAAWRVARLLSEGGFREVVVVTDRGSPSVLGRAVKLVAGQLGVACRTEHLPRGGGLRRAWNGAFRLTDRGRRGLARRFEHVRPLFLPPGAVPAKRSARILFADFFPNNLNALVPVYEEVRGGENVEALWLGMRREVGRALRRHGVRAIDLERLVGRRCARAVRRRTNEVAAVLGRVGGDPAFRSLFRHEELDLLPLLWPEVRDTVRVSISIASRVILWTEAALEHADPDVVVVANDATLGCRALVLTARRMGIPTVYLQHGHIPNDREAIAGASDQLLVWGASSRRRLVELGIQADQLIEVGAAQYDGLFGTGAAPDTGSIGGVISDGSRKVVVYTSAPASRGESEDDYVQACTAVRDAAIALPEVEFIVKLHPSENPRLWRALRRGSRGAGLRVIVRCDTAALLSRADVVVTRFSTTGMEAAILGKPLVTINLTGGPDHAPYADGGGALGVRAAAELVPAIRRVLRDPETRRELEVSRERFLRDTFVARDGLAARRAARAILETANAGARAPIERGATATA